MTILVVDDREPNLYQLQVLLGGNGYEVVTAANGAEALAKARQSPPDLIVSDILMPVMDGFTLCREWKKDERLQQIPFVFYTATYTDGRDREFALSLGAERFLVKPEEPEVFIRTIREVIQQVRRPPAPPARAPIEAPQQEEADLLKQYSEVLIRKLEAKMAQLEHTNRELERDIAERKRAEEALRNANRVFKTLSECNQALIRATDESEFLREVCRIIVEAAGYRLAWVGFAEQNEAKTVRLAARAGFEEGHLDVASITWEEADRGQHPAGRAIRTGKPCTSGRVLTDPDLKPWHAEATMHGYASVAAFPLSGGGGTFGSLNIYASEPDAFHEEEIKLLRELADDVAYGITTLRARAKRQKVETENTQLRAAIEQTSEAVLITDGAGTIQYVNPAFTWMTGYSREEAIGQNPRFLKSGKQDNLVYEHLWKTIQSGATWHGELINRRKDGTHYTEEMTITPVRNERGEIVNFIGIKEDITERKRAELMLRQREAELEEAQRIAQMGAWELAARSDTPAWSQEVYRIIGRDPELPAPRVTELSRFFTSESWLRLNAALERAFQSGVPYELDLEVVRADGTKRWITARGEAECDANGQVVRLHGTVQDITERKQAEAALRQSEERYRELFENANDVVYTHDLEGNLTSLNKAGERISGYTREEALTMNLAQVLPPEYVEPVRQATERLLTGEPQHVMELEIVTKSGLRVGVEDNSRLIYRDGKPVGIQGIARDITARKRLEEQLIQAQKMEAVGRLAGGIAHDFNNLLTVINGYCSLLSERLEPKSPYRGSLEEIQKAGERATSLTRQLLAFGRKQIIAPQVIDLNEVVSGIEKMLRRLIGEDIWLTALLAPHLGKVKVDPGQIEQVITNLVINSRDAMPNGGKITIETRDVDLDEAYARVHQGVRPARYVMLAVGDTGHGMDRETQSHIFEPFFTTKERGKGTGLGLSTVYGIVKQSGGHVWVYSEPGHGTVFKIYFPQVAEEVPKAEKGAPASDEVASRGETVLLVEDELAVRMLVRNVLDAKGYRVLEARNGEDAMMVVEQHKGPIHLLITDVVMPGMSGREVAERLAPLHREMKLLYMSGYTDNAIVHHGELEAGVAFIQKPFSPEALVRKVREVLEEL